MSHSSPKPRCVSVGLHEAAHRVVLGLSHGYPRSATGRRRLRADVAALLGRLQVHTLQAEAEGGVVREIEAAKGRNRDLSQLCEDHKHLIDLAENLALSLEAREKEAASAKEFLQSATAFLNEFTENDFGDCQDLVTCAQGIEDRLRQHESRVTTVLQQSVALDIPAID